MIDLIDPPGIVQPADTLPVIRGSGVTAPTAQGGYPNDPYYPEQWALQMIHAPAAWALAEELIAAGHVTARPVKLAILDTHMDPRPQFAPELNIGAWWNIGTGQPIHNNVPLCPHATHVASIAASATNNGLGMAGVSWGPEILAVQVLSGCFGTQTYCAFGISYAADQGAWAINMSLQYGDIPNQAMSAAAADAYGRGCFLVAASGNYSWNDKLAVPAMLTEVVGVGAINKRGERAHWSNAGDDLELVAPGVDVLGLATNGYENWSGTSMASPHVAGAAVLLKTVYPHLKNYEVRDILNATATDLGEPGRDPYYGYGCLNVYRALRAADPCPADMNKDGLLTAKDFSAFQSSFVMGEYRADCTGDEVLNIADFACFQDQFAGGC